MDTLTNLGFDLANETRIRLDLDDRPQKSPRACVIASDRTEGRAPDHPRAGRPPRLPGLPPRGGARAPLRGLRPEPPVHVPEPVARPRADRDLLVHPRDDLAASRPGTPQYFGLVDEEAQTNAEATTFLEALLYRRYAAKLGFELDFWGRFAEDGGTPDGYSEQLGEATGVRYRPDGYLADMDAGFYSADYLRAWIRSAQLRALPRLRGRRRLVALAARPASACATLFSEGTRPSSEEIAARIGFDPLDTDSARLRAFGVESADA